MGPRRRRTAKIDVRLNRRYKTYEMIIQKNRGKVVQPESTPRETFKMVAKTMVNLEEVLAEELRQLGA